MIIAWENHITKLYWDLEDYNLYCDTMLGQDYISKCKNFDEVLKSITNVIFKDVKERWLLYQIYNLLYK
jgi:hypothetical protein